MALLNAATSPLQSSVQGYLVNEAASLSKQQVDSMEELSPKILVGFGLYGGLWLVQTLSLCALSKMQSAVVAHTCCYIKKEVCRKVTWMPDFGCTRDAQERARTHLW